MWRGATQQESPWSNLRGQIYLGGETFFKKVQSWIKGQGIPRFPSFASNLQPHVSKEGLLQEKGGDPDARSQTQ